MDFLNTLKDLLQFDSGAEFSRVCKKRPPNMSNYLNGVSEPGVRVLEDCLLNATISRVFDDTPDEGYEVGEKSAKTSGSSCGIRRFRISSDRKSRPGRKWNPYRKSKGPTEIGRGIRALRLRRERSLHRPGKELQG